MSVLISSAAVGEASGGKHCTKSARPLGQLYEPPSVQHVGIDEEALQIHLKATMAKVGGHEEQRDPLLVRSKFRQASLPQSKRYQHAHRYGVEGKLKI
jgi:hypothetical protein